jgi:hypothetical protein
LIRGCIAVWAALLTGCVARLIHAHQARRRRLLNEALHELRRPLQELALRTPAVRSGWVEPAIAALAEVDSIVNGRPCGARVVEFSVADVVGAGRSRWSPDAVDFQVEADGVRLIGDPAGIGAALDNLISNAVEHGTGPVTVRAGGSNGTAVLSVASAPAAAVTGGPRGADPRRGHGLRIAERVATEHHGALERPRLIRGAVTTRLILPTQVDPPRARNP